MMMMDGWMDLKVPFLLFLHSGPCTVVACTDKVVTKWQHRLAEPGEVNPKDFVEAYSRQRQNGNGKGTEKSGAMQGPQVFCFLFYFTLSYHFSKHQPPNFQPPFPGCLTVSFAYRLIEM